MSMRKSLSAVIGVAAALAISLGMLLGLGTSPRRSVSYPNFVCATVLNTYGVCVGPPTADR